MEIILSEDAIQWFETKFPLNEGEAVRFFGKTYGKTEVHDGFSLGMQLDDPEKNQDIIALTEINNRQYFFTREDEWFFGGYNLEITLDDKLNEPRYHFTDSNSKSEDAE